MPHLERHNYIRKTAIDNVKALLKNLPEHAQHPGDAIRMVDRTIGGLLGHPDSPSYIAYRDYTFMFFPSGLEATVAGKDIILTLNSKKATVKREGRACLVDIPDQLKHPEKGVAQIIGHHLARVLFMVRGAILTQLIEKEENGVEWQLNAGANDEALTLLKDYNPYRSMFIYPVAENVSPSAGMHFFSPLGCCWD